MKAPFDPNARAAQGAGIFGLPFDEREARTIIVPVPFAPTTSYGGGTEDGPRAVFDASMQVDLCDRELGAWYEGGVALAAEDPKYREWHDRARPLVQADLENYGSLHLEEVNRITEACMGAVRVACRSMLEAQKLVCVLGGDHSTPLGLIEALSEAGEPFGILHIDAHADLRVAYEGYTFSHASIMHNVLERCPSVSKLVQVGIRDFCDDELATIESSAGRIKTFFDSDVAARKLEGTAFARVADEIVAALPQRVYVSFDIDGLDPALCPHTGTKVPGGLSFYEATLLLRRTVETGRTIVGCDLCEVAPGPEGDEWDGNVGARILYRLLGWMQRSQRQ